jgi:uncharacterized protein (TIGR02246 family)
MTMTVEAEIDALFGAWKAAVSAKDIERVASLTTEDCEFWTSSAPAMIGRDALRATLKTFYANYDHRRTSSASSSSRRKGSSSSAASNTTICGPPGWGRDCQGSACLHGHPEG